MDEIISYKMCAVKVRNEKLRNYLKRSGLTSLRNRRLQDIAIYMYKVKNQLAPSSVAEIVRVKKGRYSLQNSDFDIPDSEQLVLVIRYVTLAQYYGQSCIAILKAHPA